VKRPRGSRRSTTRRTRWPRTTRARRPFTKTATRTIRPRRGWSIVKRNLRRSTQRLRDGPNGCVPQRKKYGSRASGAATRSEDGPA
jgi:hypothetical protein